MTDQTISITVNDQSRESTIPGRTLLSDYLRHTLGLTGTRVGCEQGVCGACTVEVDGLPVRSCLTFAVQTDGHRVRTVEALTDGAGGMHPLQEAFHRHYALQCGFCTSGFLMSIVSKLDDLYGASREEIRREVSGNICRCTGYQAIVDAVADCAASREADTEEEVS